MQPGDEWLATDAAAVAHGLDSQLGQENIRQVIRIFRLVLHAEFVIQQCQSQPLDRRAAHLEPTDGTVDMGRNGNPFCFGDLSDRLNKTRSRGCVPVVTIPGCDPA